MILVGTQGRAPHPALDAFERTLRRLPTPGLSSRQARQAATSARWCFTAPHLGFTSAVEDGRTLRRLERHTRSLGERRGLARVVVPAGVRPGYLLALAAAQERLPLVYDPSPEDRAAAQEAGLRLVARSPLELESGGYGFVGDDLKPWLELAVGLGALWDEVYLFAPLPAALELKRRLQGM